MHANGTYAIYYVLCTSFTGLQGYWCFQVSYLYSAVVFSSFGHLSAANWLLGLSRRCVWCHVSEIKAMLVHFV